MDINDVIRNVMMATIGTVSYTLEKSKDIAANVVARGEEVAREKGISYDEAKEQVMRQLRDLKEKFSVEIGEMQFEDMLEAADTLTDDQRAQLISRLLHPQTPKQNTAEETKETDESDETDD